MENERIFLDKKVENVFRVVGTKDDTFYKVVFDDETEVEVSISELVRMDRLGFISRDNRTKIEFNLG